MHVHPYHVPQADFTGEKMKIEVNVLVKGGSRPVLGASMCSSESIEQCVKDFTYSQVIS